MQGVVEIRKKLLYDNDRNELGGERMNPVVARGLVIGEGMPKICVPMVGETLEEILEEAKAIALAPKDLVEWRGDCFSDICDFTKVGVALREIRGILEDTPILFTFRTKKEGGQKEIAEEAYVELNKNVVKSGLVDFIDVEMLGIESCVKGLIKFAHENKVLVVGSNHDFQKTPAEEEIVRRLCYMQELGADILKIAVMPENKQDVLRLLSATDNMVQNHARQPVVTMSMAKTGMASRIMGEVFGSAITFGAMGKTSAPGQVPVERLKEMLEWIHKTM